MTKKSELTVRTRGNQIEKSGFNVTDSFGAIRELMLYENALI
jgi:hypothetical protein